MLIVPFEHFQTEEEGREAEVATTYQTRSSRSGARGQQSPYPRRGRQMRRPQPIIWQDGMFSIFEAFHFCVKCI